MKIPGSTEELRTALLGEDVLGVVVRGHLYIEAALNSLIELLLPYPQEIDMDRLKWGTKLDLVHALGLSTDLKRPLLAINKIRNSFAHVPNAILGKDEINALYSSLAESDRQMLLKGYLLTEKQVERPLEVEFRKLSAQQQFLFIVVGLHSILIVAIDDARTRKST